MAADGAKLFEQLEVLDAAQSSDDYVDAEGEWDVEALEQAIEKYPSSASEPSAPAGASHAAGGEEAEPENSATGKTDSPKSKKKGKASPPPTKAVATKEAPPKAGVVSKPPSVKKGAKQAAAAAAGCATGRLLEVSPS